jgi:hypothetical protein
MFSKIKTFMEHFWDLDLLGILDFPVASRHSNRRYSVCPLNSFYSKFTLHLVWGGGCA